MSFLLPALLLILIATPLLIINRADSTALQETSSEDSKNDTLIVVITVTYRTLTRIPELFTLGNTLIHERNLFWVVVDNSSNSSAVKAVTNIVNRTNLPSVLLSAKSEKNNTNTTLVELYNYGLNYVRNHLGEFKQLYTKVIVFFADVQYSYDLRLFSEYIRKVQKIGIWPVGRPLQKKNKEQKKLNETEMRSAFKYFDLANAAFNADLIVDKSVEFNTNCSLSSPALCFVKDLNVLRDQIQFFKSENPEDLLVWHAPKGSEPFYYAIDPYNYFVEVDIKEK